MMLRFVRILAATMVLVLVAWVLKVVLGSTVMAKRTEDLVQKIRMNEAQ